MPVFASAFGTLFNDDVRAPAGTAGQHLRWRWSQPGVVAIATLGHEVALVPAFRYPVAAVSLEFPRGGAEPGETPVETGCRELAEETGLTATTGEVVGTVHADTGLIETPVTIVRLQVTDRRGGANRAEELESFADPVWLDRAGVLAAISAGQLRCGLTLAALALLWL